MYKPLASLSAVLLLAIALSWTASAQGNLPKSVGISNLSDSSFTVTWWTDGDETGQIQRLAGDVYDDARGPAYKGANHFVTVDDLKPGATYAFDLLSGGKRYDNDGMHWQVTTGNALAPREVDVIAGRLQSADGSPTGDVIVYIMLERLQQSVVSGLQSVLVRAGQDRFQFDLGAARLAIDPDISFAYSVQGDRYMNNAVSILALGPQGSGVVTLDLGDPRLRVQDPAQMLVITLKRAAETPGTPAPSRTLLPTATATPAPTSHPHECPWAHKYE